MATSLEFCAISISRPARLFFYLFYFKSGGCGRKSGIDPAIPPASRMTEISGTKEEKEKRGTNNNSLAFFEQYRMQPSGTAPDPLCLLSPPPYIYTIPGLWCRWSGCITLRIEYRHTYTPRLFSTITDSPQVWTIKDSFLLLFLLLAFVSFVSYQISLCYGQSAVFIVSISLN